MEIEGLIPLFGVNAASFTILKLGHAIIGASFYPQIVTSLAGLLTVLGVFLLGRRILHGHRDGVLLGLLMAAQAAVMPYFVLYSRHALATIFALCVFVYALWAYQVKLQCPPVKTRRSRLKYLKKSAVAVGLLALVPACSFKFLLPTLIVFVLLETFIWRVRSSSKSEFRSVRDLTAIVIVGGLLFILIPLLVSVLSGYTDWLGRAVTLSQFHAKIKTMRLAMHFLFPVHLYYFAGPLFMVCVLIGSILMFVKSPSREWFVAGRTTSMTLAIGFAVYLLFFGMLSNLQSARLYALTLPFAVYASSVAVLQVRRFFPRFRNYTVPAVAIVLLASMVSITVDYLSKTSSIPAASDVIMKHIKKDKTIYANAKTQIYHRTFNSPNNSGDRYRLNSFLHVANVTLSKENPPIFVIQDGVDLVSTVASHDKEDKLESLDTLRTRLDAYWSVAGYADLIFAGAENFYTSPFYYLEDIYSWRSYRYVRELMPRSRDSIFVFLANPTKEGAPPPP
jgi:hypothetical protein